MANDRRLVLASATHGASTCHWAAPTLFLEPPFWFEAQQYPWSCTCEATRRLLGTTEECATCHRWEMRRAETPMRAIEAP
jgi:hypothetical protein